MIKSHTLAVTLAGAVALGAVGGNAWAESNNCGRVGTWFGVDTGTGSRWLGTHTPGVSATVGQVSLDWIAIDPSLGIPAFQGLVTQTTGGRGIWEKVNQGHYKYTWVAYGLAGPSQPVYATRVSGNLSLADCDHMDITYKLEVFLATQNMSTDSPIAVLNGTASETRMPMAPMTP